MPPSSTPDLKPVENVGQFMRETRLSNRVFQSYDDILDHYCHAWNKLGSGRSGSRDCESISGEPGVALETGRAGGAAR